MGEQVARPAQSCRILLVEDHDDTAKVMARLLAANGFVASVAPTAAHATELAGRERFDLIVSDLGLPDLDGYTLLGELHRRLGPLPAIALSGFGPDDAGDPAAARAAGFAEHLTKPVHFPTLLASIRRLLA